LFRLDPIRLDRDASRIVEMVPQHLSGLVGAEVDITIEFQASLPDGADENLFRNLTED
jgi:hypothetical protein